MEVLRIAGGRPLVGSATVGGAKNAALPIMAAALMADGETRLTNVPELTDVATLAALLRRLGMGVERDAEELRLREIDPAPTRAPVALVRRMRASFCVLGPLLAKRGRAIVPLPGGCAIGPRPVDLHLRGLAALGAELSIRGDLVVARAKRLRGATVDLTGPHGPSVTGTANVLSAATLARGETIIHGAAREPEVAELGRILNAMGARIEGLGTDRLRIRGVEQLTGSEHRLPPDRIEAGTLLIAAAITRGCVAIDCIDPNLLTGVLAALDLAGAEIANGVDWVRVGMNKRPLPVDVTATPYPGFPTDLQAQWMALMTLATGPSVVSDRVFPRRFAHVPQLRRFGANISRRGSDFMAGCAIQPSRSLRGATVRAGDLRAGAALVLAGLAARGETLVGPLRHLDRGYAHFERKLASLGGQVVRQKLPAATASPGEPFRALDDLLQLGSMAVRQSIPPHC